MTRFKKELIKTGFVLEETLPWLPYETKTSVIEGTHVDSEKCTVTTYYTSLIVITYVNSGFRIDKQEFK